jgi:mannose-1-phosphate guanylyltransferase
MQALILAGGEGTRLRPLTTGVPKPVVSLAQRPLLAYMIDWLRQHGVDDVVLACGHLAAGVERVLGDGSAIGVRLRYVEEPRALGTGGAVKFAEPMLDERFLMLNGDVLTDLDLTGLIDQHTRTGARATLGLVAVADPSAYGLVRTRDDGEVTGFVEKPLPEEIDTDQVSAGAYVLEREILSVLGPGRPASIERDVFPALVGSGLFGRASAAYWLDLGTPDRYLQGTFDILDGRLATTVLDGMDAAGVSVSPDVVNGGEILPRTLVGAGCRIGGGARVGGHAVVEAGVHVGEDTLIERSVVMRGARIGPGCVLRGCIVADDARIDRSTEINGGSVVGRGAWIGAENVIARGARVSPGAVLPDHAVGF